MRDRVFWGVLGMGALLAGCAGTPAASIPPERVALTMAFTGSFADPQISAFLRTLADLSEGAVSIDVSHDFDTNAFGVEQSIIDAVRAGDLDLGWVGVRAFAERGVHDFDALIAPFLIDSLAMERAVLDSGIPDRMLAGLDAIDIDGLAVIGGALRRPIAAEAPLLTAADFVGVPFHAWHGDIGAATITTLGAQYVDAAPPDRNAGIESGSIRAYENTLDYLADTPGRRANIMTSNISLWPSIGVLFASPAALARLSSAQRDAVRDAATKTAERSIDLLEPEAERALTACAGGARLAETSIQALADLRVAVEPVYATLRTDERTKGYLNDIGTLKNGSAPDAIDVPRDCAVAH